MRKSPGKHLLTENQIVSEVNDNTNLKHKRIFLGIRDVAGFASRLADGFREKGVPVILGLFFQSKYGYGSENADLLNRCIQKFNGRRGKGRFQRIQDWLAVLSKLVLFIRSIVTATDYIFIGTESFFGLKELPLLKLFGKKIVFVFLGSDCRPWYLNGEAIWGDGKIDVRECKKRVERQKQKLASIEKSADVIICHPPSAQLLEKPFIPFLNIGLPAPRLSGFLSGQSTNGEDVVRIVHAPSNPKCKGTEVIREEIERMRTEGMKIAFIELVGKTNYEVLTYLEQCDFVVDEIYSDTSLATLGLEAACMAKPTITGSYTRRVQDYGVEENMIPPSLLVQPEMVGETIASLCASRDIWRQAGDKARIFAEKVWSAEAVAERMLQLLYCSSLQIKLYDPKKISYFHGWGVSEHALKEYLFEYVEKNGVKALQLTDKPALRRGIINFISSK